LSLIIIAERWNISPKFGKKENEDNSEHAAPDYSCDPSFAPFPLADLAPLIRDDGRVYFSRMRRGQWCTRAPLDALDALPRGINHIAAAAAAKEAEEEARRVREKGRRRL